MPARALVTAAAAAHLPVLAAREARALAQRLGHPGAAT